MSNKLNKELSMCDKACNMVCKESCCKEVSSRQFKVVASIKKDYYVKDIKRYVLPHMFFLKLDEVYNKPFICESNNVEFMIDRIYTVVDVLGYEGFESVTISTI